MKAKTIFISALAAAGLLMLVERQLAKPPVRDTRAVAHRAPGPDGDTERAFPAPRADPIGFDPATMNETGATSRPATGLNSGGETNDLGIPADHLRDARRTAEETILHMRQGKAALNDARYFNQSLNAGNPSKKLALRLGLDPVAAQKVDTVLAGALAGQIQERIEAERARIERESRLLAENREGYVNYLALQSMQSRGDPLSAEQSAFCDGFRRMLSPADASAAPSVPDKWYEDANILEAVNRQLPTPKQSELAAYVEDQKHRDQELRAMQARMRANQIAEQLGLSQADQSTLLEYLQESPDASNAEIAAILPSGLRELLPSGM